MNTVYTAATTAAAAATNHKAAVGQKNKLFWWAGFNRLRGQLGQAEQFQHLWPKKPNAQWTLECEVNHSSVCGATLSGTLNVSSRSFTGKNQVLVCNFFHFLILSFWFWFGHIIFESLSFYFILLVTAHCHLMGYENPFFSQKGLRMICMVKLIWQGHQGGNFIVLKHCSSHSKKKTCSFILKHCVPSYYLVGFGASGTTKCLYCCWCYSCT